MDTDSSFLSFLLIKSFIDDLKPISEGVDFSDVNINKFLMYVAQKVLYLHIEDAVYLFFLVNELVVL